MKQEPISKEIIKKVSKVVANKKRKKEEISKPRNMSDEIDEQEDYVAKRRKLNDQFDKPIDKKKVGNISSSFMINKKIQPSSAQIKTNQISKPSVVQHEPSNLFSET
jgi:hypothetical protein